MSESTLWILEDDLDLLQMMGLVAEQRGYRVYSVSSLCEAWELASHTHEMRQPTLILSDLNLGDGDSEVWLKEMRARFPTTRLTCISGAFDDQTVTRLKAFDVVCVPKPLSLSELFKILD